MPNQFALDVEKLRTQAREHMEQGAVMPTYGIAVDEVVSVLNDVPATEVVCWARYQQHAIVASGIDRGQVAQEFSEHAAAEMQHALWAAERIVIQSYQEIVRWIGDADPTARRLLERILEQEEEHADDLSNLLSSR